MDNLPDVPVVIRNKINNWEILQYTERDWCNEFKDALRFRQGYRCYTERPQWEKSCEVRDITLKNFFEISAQKHNDKWLYFDYKYMKNILPGNSKLLGDVKWVDLGFDLFGKDSTMWIGNEGAHTPCHMDSYGCNFIAQIYGRKLWILIPPQETEALSISRVPYEESSIYSSHNFYTPNDKLLEIKHAYSVILSAGEVLYVPRHWWHYVENLEVAISVNVWIPLDVDHESRLEESLVRHYISNICQDLTEEDARQLLNPTEYGLMSEPCTFETVQICLENCQSYRNGKSVKAKNSTITFKNTFGNNEEFKLEEFDIKSYINDKSKSHRYDPSEAVKSANALDGRLAFPKALINSYCHPNNVNSIKNRLLDQWPMINN